MTLMKTVVQYPVEFIQGSGSWLISTNGEKYLDFFTDVGTASLGYGSEFEKHAIQRALNLAIPLHMPNLFKCPERERAARRLCEATGMHRAFFCNSGTEAVEAAIKLARLNTCNKMVASVTGSFHGRTYGSLAAGDGPQWHYQGFGPMPEFFVHWDPPAMPPTGAGIVIIAPIFGNNDVRMYGVEWLHELKNWCQKRGVILIFDEVQTGSCRASGAMSYSHHYGVTPDILCLAKGVAMGAPVGVTLSRNDMDFRPGSHFSTFGGSPFSSAMVNAMLDWAEVHGGMDTVNVVGKYIRNQLKQTLWAKNVRGDGLLIAFDWDGDCMSFALAALQEHLLIGAFRHGPGPIKLTPPLNIATHDVVAGLDALGKAAARMESA
jgi:acetylornithine/N-succinyldiaminopimelate aminotransferase